jgi:hypothetical protein
VYPFILDFVGYPLQVINFFIIIVRDDILPFIIDTHVNFVLGLVLAAIQEAKCETSIQRYVVVLMSASTS